MEIQPGARRQYALAAHAASITNLFPQRWSYSSLHSPMPPTRIPRTSTSSALGTPLPYAHGYGRFTIFPPRSQNRRTPNRRIESRAEAISHPGSQVRVPDVPQEIAQSSPSVYRYRAPLYLLTANPRMSQVDVPVYDSDSGPPDEDVKPW